MSDVTPPEGSSGEPTGADPTPPGGYGAPPPPPPPPPPPGPPPAGGDASAANQPFQVGAAFSWGWAKFQQNVGPILGAVAIYLAIVIVVEVIAWVILRNALISTPTVTFDQTTGAITTTGGSGFIASMVVSASTNLIFIVLFAFLQAAVIRGGLMIANGEPLQISHMFNFDKYGTVLVASLIVGVASFLGIFLCFVGSLVVAFFTPFYLFFILDKGMGAWESIMASINLVKDNIGEVFLLLLAVLAAYIVGAILCGIGLLVTAPVALLALTFGYRRLQGEPVAA
ncbi:MAG: hypothetical protein OEV62_04695 [Actinomycetota bacterium]|nr:hypothetical protein [Actinomycetota bacterium]MDH4353716.1 hypothetical protein [Actinomycetota bacterium]MDH5278902.1 hypothetical protein [Actinomycetota bacterium]